MRDTPFEPLDDGVAIGEHSPRQDVPHSPKTEMLPIQGMPPSYPPHGQYVADTARDVPLAASSGDFAADRDRHTHYLQRAEQYLARLQRRW